MSLFVVDHEQASTFEALPEGEYEVVITETKLGESKEKHTPFVGMTMTIRDEAELNPVGRKRKIFHNMYYTPKTAGMFQGLFKCLMFEQGRTLDTLEDVAREIKGSTVRVKLRHEQYQDAQGNNKTAERVHYFMQSQAPLSRALLSEDPFANGSGSIDISDDDLPF